jgi:hypothetical protein
VPRIIKVGLSKVGNQIKPLIIPKKRVYFFINLEQIFKHMATVLNTERSTTQQIDMDAQKARLLLSQGYGQYEPFQNQLATCKSRLSCSPIGRGLLV